MINGTYKLGSKKIDLEKNFSSSKKINFHKIFEKTGIRFIHRTSKKENTHTLAYEVGKKNLKNIKEKVEVLFF